MLGCGPKQVNASPRLKSRFQGTLSSDAGHATSHPKTAGESKTAGNHLRRHTCRRRLRRAESLQSLPQERGHLDSQTRTACASAETESHWLPRTCAGRRLQTPPAPSKSGCARTATLDPTTSSRSIRRRPRSGSGFSSGRIPRSCSTTISAANIARSISKTRSARVSHCSSRSRQVLMARPCTSTACCSNLPLA